MDLCVRPSLYRASGTDDRIKGKGYAILERRGYVERGSYLAKCLTSWGANLPTYRTFYIAGLSDLLSLFTARRGVV